MTSTLHLLLRRLDQAVALTCRWTVLACFLGLFLLLSLGIVQRLLPLVKLSGYDELVELLFIWMTFIGSLPCGGRAPSIAWRRSTGC
jgi:TRAP-type C4-dicarboxylate transport system permease small subunit